MASGTATAAGTASYEPRFDCGRLCLDLLATSHPEERLDSVGRLCAWILGAGLVPARTSLDQATAQWLVGFRELRGHIARLVRAECKSKPKAGSKTDLKPASGNSRPVFDISLNRINELARAATPAPRAVRTDEGSLARTLDHAPDCAALLAVIARDAVELLTDPVACASLRQCAGDNCPIVYVDTSRGRRRRWCSSEICGNRERVARHRRRAAVARA
ncbi:CGNR zinc finger domain-containing protein [Streptomyces ipomoeae]|uniref:CGNR zinc finger domain-containing protein n=1 Tax=Streptomyces ipomoeae TaxID=103232 RepID=UPI0011478FE2|nr:CGNR zinc finger domain-containing protein [Streptomyces ipomoeae]MDX2934658.1 CGNR zinc finger domain-containing protein [Streptomyces ipomoeae]TQE15553.1 zf-CGNR multi-domain protein [Streptomyces ipomoeae]